MYKYKNLLTNSPLISSLNKYSNICGDFALHKSAMPLVHKNILKIGEYFEIDHGQQMEKGCPILLLLFDFATTVYVIITPVINTDIQYQILYQ